MNKLQEQLNARNFEDAEKTADSILKMMGISQPPVPAEQETKPGENPGDDAETTRKRLTEKVERIKQGVQRWAASGRDPSAIAQAMQEEAREHLLHEPQV
jgi:hypothetical protein